MGHVDDRWTSPGPSGRRVRNERWGRGRRYLARWVEPGGRERSKAFESKSGAQAHLAHVDVDIRGGTYVTRNDITFREYALTWLSRQPHQTVDTAAQAESRLRLHAYPVIGHLRLNQIDRGMIQDLIAGSTLAPASVEVLYVYVAAVFNSAVEDRLIPVTPCRRIRRPVIPKRQIEPLTTQEVGAIADNVLPHLRAMVWVAAGSGVRPGELRSLTVDRVRDGVLRVDRQLTRATRSASLVWGPPKNRSSFRSVPLAPVTLEHLEAHLEAFPPRAHGLLFTTSRGAPLSHGRMAEAWAGGGGRGRGWHELRHHNASLLIAAGLSPRAVADRLGHVDPAETLRTYSHLWPTDEGRILDAIEDAHRRSGETATDS